MVLKMAKSRTKQAIYLVFSVLVTIGVFGYLFRNVSVRDVVNAIKNMDQRGIWMFFLLSMTMTIFRTWRYDLLLNTSGYSVSRAALFLVVLVRNFFSDLLPARLGTVVYVYLVNTRLGIPFGPAASSFALAFVFDIIALVPMVALAVLFVGASVGLSVPILLSVAAALLAGSVVALWLLPQVANLAAVIVRCFPFLPKKARLKSSESLANVGGQVVAARRAGIYGRLLVLSMFVRLAKYGALYVLVFALLNPLGYGWGELKVPRVFLAICSSELAASLPISGIAGFGAYEGVWAAVFGMLGFPARIADLTSISHHLITQLYGYSLGVGAVLALLIPYFQRKAVEKRGERKASKPYMFYGRIAALVLVTVACALGGYYALTCKTVFEEVVGPNAAEKRILMDLELDRRILFDSNRSGTFGIFSMASDGSDIQSIYDSEQSDIYPDPSPDGKWIVFARAMSPSRNSPSDIWICRRDGSDARKVAQDGTFPTFSGDGVTVYFERNRCLVMAVDADGSNEREVFPCSRKGFEKYKIVKPRVSPDGRWVAFISNKGEGWNSWAVELENGKAVHVGDGCEPSWFPDSAHIIWIRERETKERTGIFRYDMSNDSKEVFHDSAAPWGHEYFSGISPDGRFLLWSACPPKQHDHETSNYQIFAKNLGNGKVARVTFDGYNNRWPKVLP